MPSPIAFDNPQQRGAIIHRRPISGDPLCRIAPTILTPRALSRRQSSTLCSIRSWPRIWAGGRACTTPVRRRSARKPFSNCCANWNGKMASRHRGLNWRPTNRIERRMPILLRPHHHRRFTASSAAAKIRQTRNSAACAVFPCSHRQTPSRQRCHHRPWNLASRNRQSWNLKSTVGRWMLAT